MSTTTELEQYAKFLRNAAPKEYDTFCIAFANYTRAMVDHVVTADKDGLVLAQGRAQACVKLWRSLEGVKDG